MQILIKQATVINSASPFNGKTKDILIADGVISSIADSINQQADITVKEQGLFVSIGWVDTFAHFTTRYEYKETFGDRCSGSGGRRIYPCNDSTQYPTSNP